MPGRSDHCSATPKDPLRSSFLSSLPPVFLAGTLLLASPAIAEFRVVTAQGEHRMGERDTREDAVRLATESAKRNALEQVATYLESVTVVEGMDVTKDEIRTYTAGLVLVLDQQTHTTLDGDTIVITVDLVAQIDTEEVSQAIAALRENEDARVELATLKQENEELQQDLDAANRALANASTPDQVQEATQQRQELLNRVQSNAMVSQAWTEWVMVEPVIYTYPWLGPTRTLVLLNAARGLCPTSPHVVAAERVFTTKLPPAPPRPPAPTATGGRPNQMPRHEVAPPSGSPSAPRSLNEITRVTPMRPPPTGNQPPSLEGRGSRNLTDVRQLNPLLPSPSEQPSSRAMTRLQQFLQQNRGLGLPPGAASRPQGQGFGSAPREAPGGQPPAARRFAPVPNQFPAPMFQQQPRMPQRFEPRMPGMGGQGGVGARGGGIGGAHGGLRGGRGR